MAIARSFYIVAVKFCEYVSALCESGRMDYVQLITSLMQLYTSALELPGVEPDSAGSDNCVQTPLKFPFGENDAYWEIDNPFVEDEPVGGSLTDDFQSIYEELKKGIICYEQGFVNDALWTWRFGFRNHWSYHAVDAIRVLNMMIME